MDLENSLQHLSRTDRKTGTSTGMEFWIMVDNFPYYKL